jgi:hypothetical protein
MSSYSASQCITELSAKPFGDYDEVWGDNIVCRAVHVILSIVNPDVGPSHPSFWLHMLKTQL